MLKNILIPTDFSEPAQNAQLYAIDLAQKFDAKLTLLQVYGVPTSFGIDKARFPLAELGRAAQDTLDEAVAKTRAQLPTTSGHIAVGDPREQILAYAKESGADLIVIGTHARRGIAHLLLGSVAEWVVRLSPIPVLTCHSDN
ncbi:MAG: hypothetical protein RL701_3488 [Pseudomonadota bacterium]